jgi:nitric oxide reductase NorQ protein
MTLDNRIDLLQNQRILEFRKKYTTEERLLARIPHPHFKYLGDEVLKEAQAAILSGKNLLLVGEKSTGKNVLCENLASTFQRPLWTVSFHINMDSSILIGTDTLEDGNVKFRPGPIYSAAKYGGFAILDEINMAKNEAIAVLHASLDHRRIIDVPGYENINLHPATRFIATMNYAYQGTRDLNEALLSRFVVIQMPSIDENNLHKLLKEEFPDMKDSYVDQLSLLFFDLKRKAESGESSDYGPDLRGIFDAVDLVKEGISLDKALELTLVNKLFDPFEKDLIRDIVRARFEKEIYFNEIFK